MTRQIVKLLRERPEEWRFTQFRAIHDGRGVNIWLANGVTFCAPCDAVGNTVPGFGPIARWRLWRAVAKAQRLRLHNRLTTPPTEATD